MAGIKDMTVKIKVDTSYLQEAIEHCQNSFIKRMEGRMLERTHEPYFTTFPGLIETPLQCLQFVLEHLDQELYPDYSPFEDFENILSLLEEND